MSNLMTKTYTFEELHGDYKNFAAPAMKIQVDGADVASGMKLSVSELSVDLSISEASSCSFTVANVYDGVKRSFSDDVKSKLQPGAMVEISLGYSSSLVLIFKGYISEISANFQDHPTLFVTGMDARKLMTDGGGTFLRHQVTSHSQAFSEVIKRYAKLVPNTEVDDTPETLKEITQRQNDYKFVTEVLAQKVKREFFILADTAYFREPGKEKSPVVTLEWGRSLTSFTRRLVYSDVNLPHLAGHA